MGQTLSTGIGYSLKYMKIKHIDDFIKNGTIHFTSIGYFINKELETGDNIIGDMYEGAIVEYLENKNNNKNNKLIEPSKIKRISRFSEVKKWGIWCNTFLTLKPKNNIEIKEKFKKGPFNFISEANCIITIGPKIISMLNNSLGGEDRQAVLLSNEFTSKLCQYMMDHNIKYHMQCVNYYDYDKESNVKGKITYKEKNRGALFAKRKQYDYQREERLLLPFDFESQLDNGNIHIGDIKNDVEVLPHLMDKIDIVGDPSFFKYKFSYINLYLNSPFFLKEVINYRENFSKILSFW